MDFNIPQEIADYLVVLDKFIEDEIKPRIDFVLGKVPKLTTLSARTLDWGNGYPGLRPPGGGTCPGLCYFAPTGHWRRFNRRLWPLNSAQLCVLCASAMEKIDCPVYCKDPDHEQDNKT